MTDDEGPRTSLLPPPPLDENHFRDKSDRQLLEELIQDQRELHRDMVLVKKALKDTDTEMRDLTLAIRELCKMHMLPEQVAALAQAQAVERPSIHEIQTSPENETPLPPPPDDAPDDTERSNANARSRSRYEGS